MRLANKVFYCDCGKKYNNIISYGGCLQKHKDIKSHCDIILEKFNRKEIAVKSGKGMLIDIKA